MTQKFYKMSDPSRTFYDETSGLCLNNNVIKPVDNFTPKVQEWIRNGGIVEVTEEGYITGSGCIAPEVADEEVTTSTQIPEEEEAAEPPVEDEVEEPSGLDALLSSSPATPKKKR